MKLLAEAKSRGVLKVATVYLVVTWLALEVGHTLFNVFDLPHGGLQALFVLLAVGFPIVVAASWYYRFGASTPEGQASSGEHHTSGQIAAVFGAVALLAVAVAIGVRYFGMGKGDASKAHGDEQHVATTAAPAAAPAAPAAFSPPEHSIAVLPFVNMSGDPKEDYFSDGLSEELLNSLARVDALQVAARTSSFSFKGTTTDVPTIAQKLNVGAVLEGSVRKAGNRVRITAQLINAVTGYHLWSETYDRDLKDVFALQTEVAEAVTSALEVTLLKATAVKIELGGTQNPEAFDAYLKGLKLVGYIDNAAVSREQVAHFTRATTLDPKFALAYAELARALTIFGGNFAQDPGATQMAFKEARGAAEKAVALAPGLGEAHAALAGLLDLGLLDFKGASAEFERAFQLAPGNASISRAYSAFFSSVGREADAIAAARRTVTLDPLNPLSYRSLGTALQIAGRHEEAISAFRQAQSLDPKTGSNGSRLGFSYYALGRLEEARAACATEAVEWTRQFCLAIVLHKLGRQADADKEFAALRTANGDTAAFQYAEIHAQWGNRAEALKWLETAYRVRDPGLLALRFDFLLDPIRDEPRFKAIEKALNFPD